MTASESVQWKGRSGALYTYKIFPLDTRWNDVAGNYIFAKRGGTGWVAIYIGQTSSLRDRLGPDHHRWDCAKRNGLTHIHVHTSVNNEAIRTGEEIDLINWGRTRPVCNG